MWSTKNNSCYVFPRLPNLPLSIKMVLHQSTFGLTAFVLQYGTIFSIYVRIYWSNIYAGCGGTTCVLIVDLVNTYGTIAALSYLIVEKWSTYTVVIKKSQDNGFKSVYYAFKRLKKYTTHYVIKACTLYEGLNRSPYITTQAFFARKNPNLAKSLASFNTFCHAIITFVDTKIT